MRNHTLLLLALAGSITLVACGDEEEEVRSTADTQLDDDCDGGDEEEVKDTGEEDTGDTGKDEVLVNPYAYVGEAHNELLACTMEQKVESPEHVMGLLVKVCGYESEGDGSELRIGEVYYDLLDSLHANGVKNGMDEQELKVLAEADYILRSQEPERALLSLEELEQQTLRDLGPQEMELLAMLSTARSSGEFWSDGAIPTKAKWWQVVLADAGGALVGSLCCSPAGGITLGVTASTLVAKDD